MSESQMKQTAKEWFWDICIAVLAGLIVGFAYYYFQNSNGFAPGGVGGLATITYHLTDYKVSWAILMLAFNLPIFILLKYFSTKTDTFITPLCKRKLLENFRLH